MSDRRKIRVDLDNHHVHLQEETVFKLFGDGYVLPQKKYLGGGEYVSTETISVQGPKGRIDGIRVLGPHRPLTGGTVGQRQCQAGGRGPCRGVRQPEGRL